MIPKHIILLASGFSFFVTAIAVYVIIMFAYRKRKMLDIPGANGKQHAIHEGAVPTSGGLAIFVGFWLTVLVFLPQILRRINIFELAVLCLITGILTFVGFIDDSQHVRARYKLVVQLLAGVIIFFLVGKELFDFGVFKINFGIFTPLVFGLFFAGVINSINFVDGLDGLASGISMIVIFVIMYISYIFRDYNTLFLSGILFVSVCAFLFFNFNPARIFMGDAGSMFLGSMIAYLSLKAGTRGNTFYIYPFLVVLFIPIVDVSWAIIRRLKNKRNIFYPDKEHIHHKLLQNGLGQRGSALLLWFTTGILAVLAIYSTYYGFTLKLIMTILLLGLWAISGWAFGWM